MRVYRFLNEEYGLLAIKDRRLKISRFNSLNDPFEMAAPAKATLAQRFAYRKMIDNFGKDHGLLCFSQSWHNPLLWSHYADQHKGICLGFDILDEIGGQVKYSSRRVQCDWARFHTDKKYAASKVRETYYLKYTHWKYESEVRYLIDLDHHDVQDGMYFIDFSNEMKLKEVIVGAKSEVSRAQLSAVLSEPTAEVKYRKARLAFESFKIVEQKNSSIW